MKKLQLLAAGLILAAVVSIPVAHAALMGGGGSDIGFLNTLYCKLTGCTMTGTLAINPSPAATPLVVRTDNTPGAPNDTLVSVGGAGSEFLGVYNSGATGGARLQLSTIPIVFGSTGATLKFTPNFFGIQNNAGGGFFNLFGGALIGVANNASATTLVASVEDGMTISTDGTHLVDFYGEGLSSASTTQAGTCSAGVLSLDPQSPVIVVDAAAGACTLTVAVTSVTSINKEMMPVRISAKNVGASTLKFASTNFASIPTRCTTTGLTVGQSALIAWSKDQSKWTFLGGCE